MVCGIRKIGFTYLRWSSSVTIVRVCGSPVVLFPWWFRAFENCPRYLNNGYLNPVARCTHNQFEACVPMNNKVS